MIELKPTQPADISAIMRWIGSQADCSIWGGPKFRYPFTEQSFSQDLNQANLPSFTLLDEKTPVAFGQCYLRENRCHLGRLIVAPPARGRSYGTKLISELVQIGAAKFAKDEISLFVKKSNTRATDLYRLLGFSPAPYPSEIQGFDDCYYMVADQGDVLKFCAARL